ncbi:hypothetical protein [Comamonas testosteroni]|uniref:hypothetical protein n=1 Tax=Comamonas testosteroni TaxID=285 RepID=UPI0005B5062D|nr:hypothetical protein [Comamonas testosteroni]
MATFPVKWAHSSMRGAPVISGTAGTLISALRAFLITGFAAVNAVSASALDGIATIVLPSGQSFDEYSVVLLSGALAGEARVLTSSSDRITVATTAPNGPITGSLSVRYAPVGGWEELFAGAKANVAVFRSIDPTGSRMFLRVDDSGSTFARVVGYESMTDIDTGTGPFPSAAQGAGGGYWHRAQSAGAVAVRWKLVGDSKFFAHAICPYTGAGVGDYSVAPCRGFGDPIAMSPSGDVWACALSVSSTAAVNVFNVGAFDASSLSTAANGAVYSPRAFSGLGSSTMFDARPLTGQSTANFSGADPTLGACPSAIDGQVKTSIAYIKEANNAAAPPRSVVPGVHFVPQTGLISVLADGDILVGAGNIAGRRLLAVGVGNGGTSVALGRYLLDITGPWRP